RPEPKGPESLGPPVGSTLPPTLPRSFKISVRAWVNGQPLYDDEIYQGLPPQALQEITKWPEAQRNEKLKEILTKQVESVIDQELMYQDAVAKLMKGNPKALDKLKDLAKQDYEKQLKRIRANSKVSE